MSDHKPKVHTIYRLDDIPSEIASQLLDALKPHFGDRDEELENCVISLYRKGSRANDYEKPGDPKLMKSRYTRTLKAIRALEASIQDFDIPERETLSDLIEGFEDDETLAMFDTSEANPDMNGVYGLTIWETKQQLRILGKALEHAMGRIKVLRGAKPKEHERNLAIDTKDELEFYELELSTYDDGVYFRILAILFSEFIPESGPEAHRRHGALALKLDDEDTEIHDIKYLPLGSVDT